MKEKLFKYGGYTIPTELVMLTGGGTDDWETISNYHQEMYRRYTPLREDDFVLEVGCGVGRDAIVLSKILSKKGRYVGFDIIKPSIDWCKKNITKKYSNFTFKYYDVESQIHNNKGTLRTSDISLPAEDNSVDLIILHSVFTHMFENDIIHYLKEFKRVLKPTGLVLSSFFIIDNVSSQLLKNGPVKGHRHPLTFSYKYSRGCFINDKEYPEGAVAYTPELIKNMLLKGGFVLNGGFVHRGIWSGVKDASNGQDILILQKASRSELIVQQSQKMKFTNR